MSTILVCTNRFISCLPYKIMIISRLVLDYLTFFHVSLFPCMLFSIASSAPSSAQFGKVCREFQRGNCTRSPSECRFAHPPESISVDACDNAVTVCMDHLKGKCSRDTCKYFHPPQHLQVQIKTAQQRAF